MIAALLAATAPVQAMPMGMPMPMPHGSPATARDSHAGHAPAPAGAPAERAVGDAPPPAPPVDHYAERAYSPSAMAAARDLLRREHGGGTYAMASLPIAEYRAGAGRDGYRWNAAAWYGGDRHRAVLTSEGEGERGRAPDQAEVQLLYSRPLDPYWDVRGGVRRDIGRGARRTYAAIGVAGLAPYWIEVEGTLFLSDRGDLLARVEASYDQRITQRLILQPRLEVEAAAGDVPSARIGRGLGEVKADLRLRYAVVPEFAPYAGVGLEHRFGRTARLARADGGDVGGIRLLLGVAAFF